MFKVIMLKKLGIVLAVIAAPATARRKRGCRFLPSWLRNAIRHRHHQSGGNGNTLDEYDALAHKCEIWNTRERLLATHGECTFDDVGAFSGLSFEWRCMYDADMDKWIPYFKAFELAECKGEVMERIFNDQPPNNVECRCDGN